MLGAATIGLQQETVKHVRTLFGIPVGILDEDLVDNAALARPAIIAPHMRRCTVNPEPHFTRCVSTEHRPILH